MALTRRLVLVALMVYLALTLTIVTEYTDLPRFQLCDVDALPGWLPEWLTAIINGSDAELGLACENSDIVVLATLLTMVLIETKRRLRWALAPALTLSVLHAVFVFRDGLPESDYRIDWQGIAGTLLFYVVLALLAVMTFLVVTGAGLAMRGIARRLPVDPAAMAARHHVRLGWVRRAASVAAAVLVGVLVAGALLTFTDAYEFASVRWQAGEATRNGQAGWASLLAETRGGPAPAQSRRSATTLMALARAYPDGDVGAVYRREALERALEECSNTADTCDSLARSFEDARLSAEANTLLERMPLPCDVQAAATMTVTYAALARALRGCLQKGDAAAASTIWSAALDLSTDSREDLSSIPQLLAHIPADAPVPDAAFVYRRSTEDRYFEPSVRSGALFQGLARAGRTDDALAHLARIEPDELDRVDPFFDPPSTAPPRIAEVAFPAALLVKAAALIGERYSGRFEDYSATGWRRQIARRLAAAGESQAALGVVSLPGDADGETIDVIVAALTSQKAFDLALATLDALDASSYQRTLGRLCLAMARAGELQPCLDRLDRVDYRDRTKFALLAGRQLIVSGPREQGERLVAEATAATLGQDIDAELATAFAAVGQVRLARHIANALPDEPKLEVYRAVARAVTGWRRDLGAFLGRVGELLDVGDNSSE
jgi:hypothetical protein